MRALAGAESSLTSGRPVSCRFFDTFDWRLYGKGLALVHEDRVFRLRDRRTGEVLAEQPASTDPAPPFARDWEPGELRDRLRGVVKVRALVHLASLEGSARGLDHTDPKTDRLWRLEFLELKVARGDRELGFPHAISIQPVDGRPKGGKRLVKMIRAAGLRPLPPTLLEPTLLVARIRPAAYSGKVRVKLDPDRPARESAVLLAEHLLDVMAANLTGVRRDVDTEFLHDTRVAMRRTRTLLSRFKTVLPKSLRREYGKRFRELGALTGPLRDLDVQLLQYAEFKTLVPAKRRAGLQELHAQAAGRRAEAFRTLADRIDADDFGALVRDWRAALRDPESWREAPEGAGRRTGDLAREMVDAGYHRLLDIRAAMDDEPGEEELHRLRIALKKFRYVLEFFGSLSGKKALAGLMAVMKDLQDLLGEHHDLSVQDEDLGGLLEEPEESGLSKAALRTARTLRKMLAARRAELRAEFSRKFAVFSSGKTAKKVRKLVR